MGAPAEIALHYTIPLAIISTNMKKFLALFFSIALGAALHVHAGPVANNTPGFIKSGRLLGTAGSE